VTASCGECFIAGESLQPKTKCALRAVRTSWHPNRHFPISQGFELECHLARFGLLGLLIVGHPMPRRRKPSPRSRSSPRSRKFECQEEFVQRRSRHPGPSRQQLDHKRPFPIPLPSKAAPSLLLQSEQTSAIHSSPFFILPPLTPTALQIEAQGRSRSEPPWVGVAATRLPGTGCIILGERMKPNLQHRILTTLQHDVNSSCRIL